MAFLCGVRMAQQHSEKAELLKFPLCVINSSFKLKIYMEGENACYLEKRAKLKENHFF